MPRLLNFISMAFNADDATKRELALTFASIKQVPNARHHVS